MLLFKLADDTQSLQYANALYVFWYIFEKHLHRGQNYLDIHTGIDEMYRACPMLCISMMYKRVAMRRAPISNYQYCYYCHFHCYYYNNIDTYANNHANNHSFIIIAIINTLIILLYNIIIFIVIVLSIFLSSISLLSSSISQWLCLSLSYPFYHKYHNNYCNYYHYSSFLSLFATFLTLLSKKTLLCWPINFIQW